MKLFVKNCLVYQKAKTVDVLPAGLLHHYLYHPHQVQDDVAINFITGLPNSLDTRSSWWLLIDWQNTIFFGYED